MLKFIQQDITEEQKEAKRQTDCATFIFKKTTSANWQEAGVNNVKLKWVWVDLQTGTSRTMEVPMDHVVIGFPTYYTNSYDGSISQHTAGRAANRAAMAVEQARRATYIKFAHEGLPMEVTVRSFFMQTLNALVAANQGTAGYNGMGSNNIVFNDEERSYITDPLDCDPDGGIE